MSDVAAMTSVDDGLPDAMVARLVEVLAAIGVVVIAVHSLAALWDPNQPHTWWAKAASLAFALAIFGLARQGHWRLGRWALVGGTWVVGFGVVALNGGNQSVNVAGWFPVIVLTAAMFGSRGALVGIALQWLLSGLMHLLASGGWILGPQTPPTAMHIFSEVAVSCVMTALVLTATMRALEAQLALAEQSEEEARIREAVALTRIANFHRVARAMPDTVLVVDESSGWLTYVSPGALELTALTPADALEDPQRFVRRFRASDGSELPTQLGRWPRLLRVAHPSGERWVEALPSSLINRSRRVVVLRDVTAAHNATVAEEQEQRALERVQQMEALGRLSGAVAHDFRNLLSAMRGLTVMIEADLATDHPARADLREVGDAVSRASELTGELLAISRVPDDEVAIDLGRHMRRAVWMLRRLVRANITFVDQTAQESMRVMLAPRLFESFVFGAVLGIQEQLTGRGTLSVRTEIRDSRVVISIMGAPLSVLQGDWLGPLEAGLPEGCAVSGHVHDDEVRYELVAPMILDRNVTLGHVVIHETHANLGRALGRLLSRLGFEVHLAESIRHACELAGEVHADVAMIHGDRSAEMAELLRAQLDLAAPGVEVIWTMPQGSTLPGNCLEKPYGPDSLQTLLKALRWMS